ncbi:hypothetical protein CF319_g9267 [Tilletia indica]|nr:hypothetical protein CF319_g9267 [Tilletia indica]
MPSPRNVPLLGPLFTPSPDQVALSQDIPSSRFSPPASRVPPYPCKPTPLPDPEPSAISAVLWFENFISRPHQSGSLALLSSPMMESPTSSFATTLGHSAIRS